MDGFLAFKDLIAKVSLIKLNKHVMLYSHISNKKTQIEKLTLTLD